MERDVNTGTKYTPEWGYDHNMERLKGVGKRAIDVQGLMEGKVEVS